VKESRMLQESGEMIDWSILADCSAEKVKYGTD